jgi:hypothetical protein
VAREGSSSSFHPELLDLELASLLDDAVERLAEHVGVDEVTFHHDRLVDHDRFPPG